MRYEQHIAAQNIALQFKAQQRSAVAALRPHLRRLPDFPDSELMRNAAIIEAQTYADAWHFESTNLAIGYQVVGKAGTPEQIARW